MERAPLLCMAFAVGVGGAAALPLMVEQRVVACAIGMVLAIGTLIGAQSRFAPLIFAVVLLGYGWTSLRISAERPWAEEHTQRYVATVLGSSVVAGGSVETTVQLEDHRKLIAALREGPPSVGTRVIIRGRATPFDPPRNPGEPDRRLIERERGLDGMLAGAVVLRALPDRAASSVDTFLARLRASAFERLRRTSGEPYASIIAGELWGEKTALPIALRQEFQDSGTVHVLVTAGLHLGIVAWLTILLMGWLQLPRVPACAIAASVVWAYAIFSGAHLPAVRAASMITFVLAARAYGGKAFSWNALGAAALVAILCDPHCLLSDSFAMSFSCVGAIFLTAPLIKERLERIAALPSIVSEAVTLSIATQIGIWPLTAGTFLLFAPYAVLANAVVVPFVGITMVLGTLQILFADVSVAAQSLANFNMLLLQFVIGAVQGAATLPYAHVVMTTPPPWAIASYDGALIAACWLVRRGALTAAGASLICAACAVLWPPTGHDRMLKISILDVGQADAIVVQTPGEHVLLVDAGGRLERGAQSAQDSMAERIGESVVAPFLIRAGVHHLDAVLLSHPHGDHAGGLAPVLRRLGAEQFADSGQHYGGYAYNDALAVAHAENVPIIYPRAGTSSHTTDGVSLTFLGPSLPFITGSRNDINNNSIVFMLQYKSFRVLFTGDAGTEAEQRILGEGVDLHADVPTC